MEQGIYTRNINGVYDEFNTNKYGNYSKYETVIGTWLDKPLYRKIINFGALPNATAKSVNHNISNINTITFLQGVATYTTNGTAYPIPFSSSDPTNNIALTANNTAITITTGSNRSAITQCYVILEYTKTTD